MKALAESEYYWLRRALLPTGTPGAFDPRIVEVFQALTALGLVGHTAETLPDNKHVLHTWRVTEAGYRAMRVHSAARAAGVL